MTYRVNTSGVDTDLRTSLLDAGAEMWSDVGARFSFKDGGTTTSTLAEDGVNVISWADGLPYGVLAWTLTSVDGAVISEIDIEFSNAFAWSDGAPGSGTYDLQTTASHELGHWLALLDQYMPADAEKVMYGYGDKRCRSARRRPGDIAGITWIYGGGPGPTPTPTTTPTVSPTRRRRHSATAPTPTPTPSPADVGAGVRSSATPARGAAASAGSSTWSPTTRASW